MINLADPCDWFWLKLKFVKNRVDWVLCTQFNVTPNRLLHIYIVPSYEFENPRIKFMISSSSSSSPSTIQDFNVQMLIPGLTLEGARTRKHHDLNRGARKRDNRRRESLAFSNCKFDICLTTAISAFWIGGRAYARYRHM